MLATDTRAILNVFAKSPGSALGPAFFAFTLPVMTLFPFALVFGNAPRGAAVPALTVILAFVFLANLAPFSLPPVASLAATLPIPPRAFYAHGTFRLLTTLTFGYAFAMLPILVLLAIFAPRNVVDVFLTPLPFLGAAGLAAALGRAVWALRAGRPAEEGWLLRAGLLLWLSIPALLFALRVPGADLAGLYGPLNWIAAWVLDPNFLGASSPRLAYVGCLAACALLLLVPVRAYPPAPGGRSGRLFSLAGASAGRDLAAMPRGRALFQRPLAPFHIPKGPVRAPLHLTLQWMKSLLFLGIGYLVFSFILEAVGRAQLGARRGFVFTIDPFLFLAVVYLIALWGIGFGVDPHVGTSKHLPFNRLMRTGARRVPRLLRVGPFPLELKRWSQLQTLPLSRAAMQRAFLVPLAVLLALVCAVAFWTGGSLGRWNADSWRIATLAVGFVLIATGGTIVGMRSSKRFARREETALGAVQAVSAGLWMAAILPLAFVGALGSANWSSPWGPPLGEWGFAVFLLAAGVMPVFAYATAWERLVAVNRPYESQGRPLALVAGACVFFVFPAWLIAFWVLR